MQRRLNVFDVGSPLYRCYTNVLCLLGIYDLSSILTNFGESLPVIELVFGLITMSMSACSAREEYMCTAIRIIH